MAILKKAAKEENDGSEPPKFTGNGKENRDTARKKQTQRKRKGQVRMAWKAALTYTYIN